MNRMNPRYKLGIWLGLRNNGAECFIGKSRRNQKSGTAQQRRQRGHGRCDDHIPPSCLVTNSIVKLGLRFLNTLVLPDPLLTQGGAVTFLACSALAFRQEVLLSCIRVGSSRATKQSSSKHCSGAPMNRSNALEIPRQQQLQWQQLQQHHIVNRHGHPDRLKISCRNHSAGAHRIE